MPASSLSPVAKHAKPNSRSSLALKLHHQRQPTSCRNNNISIASFEWHRTSQHSSCARSLVDLTSPLHFSFKMLLRNCGSANLIRPCLRTLRPSTTTRNVANRTHQPNCLSNTSVKVPQRQIRLALVAYRPFTTSLIRSQDVKLDSRKFNEEKGEKMFGKEKLEAHPDDVSSSSSMTPVMDQQAKATGEEKIGRDEDDMLAEIKSDLVRQWRNLPSLQHSLLYICNARKQGIDSGASLESHQRCLRSP